MSGAATEAPGAVHELLQVLSAEYTGGRRPSARREKPQGSFRPLGVFSFRRSRPRRADPVGASSLSTVRSHRPAEAVRRVVLPPGPGPKAASGGPLRDRHSPFEGVRSNDPVILSDPGPTLSGRWSPVRFPVPVTNEKVGVSSTYVHRNRWFVFAFEVEVSRTGLRPG